MSDRLIFVYNANVGIAAAILDSVHKTLSPATYDCSLCAITYGSFTMDRRWKAWLKTLPYDTVFHHRQDFRSAYPGVDVALPAILMSRDSGITTLMSGKEIAEAVTVDALIAALERKLA